jgi:prolyl 4-hydroxylase
MGLYGLAGTRGEILSDAPRLVTYSTFLTPELCSYLIERAPSKLVQAKVYDAYAGGLKVDPMRTNKGAVFSVIDTDLIIQLIRARIARAAAVAPEALEPPEILHYAVGERYKPHVDFFHPSLPNFAEQMRVKGQRVKTCLVYLNEDLEGGETDFPKIGVKFRGRTGDALIFQNVQSDGTGDLRTLHAGLPPTRGEKWLLSQWIRNKPQPIA